jgi:YVTN family beta-propeller protein
MTGTMPGMEGMDHGAMANPDQPFDAQFIDSMIEHHQGAIDMATPALEQAEHDELRAMAEEIIAAQEGEIVRMQEWRAAWYPDIAATTGMGMAMGDMELGGDDSVPFDRRFMEAMISHHRGAIMMAQAALENAEHVEIRELAEAIIAAQEAEIAQIHEWINAWYPAAGQAAPATAGLTGSIWVANEKGNSLSVIDAATNAVVTTLTGIEGPHNVQVAPDGRTVWAVSGHDNLAVAVDAQDYGLLGVVPVGASPAHVVVSPDGATAWVSNSGDNTVSVIDTAAYTVVQTISVGEFPHGLRSSPDGAIVAVADMRSNAVSLIDAATYEVQSIEVGNGPVQVAFAPDGAALYVTLNGDDAVAKLDLASRTVVGTAAVGDGPVQVYVTPDSRFVLVANQGTEETPSTTLSIVDAESMEAVAEIETGQGAHGVAVEPSGRYAYVSNLYGNTLAVVDLETRVVVATVATGAAPNGVSVSPLAPAAGGAEVLLPVAEHAGADEGEGEPEVHDEHH